MRVPISRTALRTADLLDRVQMSPAERARVTAHVEQIESLIEFVASVAARMRARATPK